MNNDSSISNRDTSFFLSSTSVLDMISDPKILIWLQDKFRHLLPIFCCVGILGNSMALILIRTNFWLKRLTSNMYLSTLSISSCLFLITVIVSWADTYLNVPIYGVSEIGCKFFTFLAHSSDFICVWMISLISWDRMVVLYRPSFRRWVCTKKFARNMSLGTIILSCVLYSWIFAFAGLESYNDGSFCGLSSNINLFGYQVRQHYFVFTLMDTAICTLIPAIFIIIVNTFSTIRYRQCMKIYSSGVLRVRFVKAPTTEQQERQLNDDTIQFEETTVKKYLLSCDNTHSNLPSSSTQSSNCGKLRSSDLQLSRTLIIVTSTFVVLNMPSYIMRITQYLFAPSSDLFHFIYFLCLLIYYVHHAVLFYMYIFWRGLTLCLTIAITKVLVLFGGTVLELMLFIVFIVVSSTKYTICEVYRPFHLIRLEVQPPLQTSPNEEATQTDCNATFGVLLL